MGRGTGQTWKDKIAADTDRISHSPQFRALFDAVESCEHKVVLREYEVLDSPSKEETVCKECGLFNPPKTKGQRTLWSCDCDHENANSRTDCALCGTERGKRIPEVYDEGARSYELLERFRENLPQD